MSLCETAMFEYPRLHSILYREAQEAHLSVIFMIFLQKFTTFGGISLYLYRNSQLFPSEHSKQFRIGQKLALKWTKTLADLHNYRQMNLLGFSNCSLIRSCTRQFRADSLSGMTQHHSSHTPDTANWILNVLPS